MELMLMRHAEAEDADGTRWPDDDLRPLTRRGRKMQRKVAKALRRMGLVPDHVFTSPRVRALDTAEISAEAWGLKELIETPALGRKYSPRAVVDLLRDFSGDERVMLVGHEPDLSQLAATLLGPAAGPGIIFKKSAVLGLAFARQPAMRKGNLLYFYRAKDLLRL